MKKILIAPLIISLALILFFSFFSLFRVKGDGMEPTVKLGDYVISKKTSPFFQLNPSRGDIIVYRSEDLFTDGRVEIARVTGLPRESVRLLSGNIYIKSADDRGEIFKLEESFQPSRYYARDIEEKGAEWIEIGTSEYYVTKDKRYLNRPDPSLGIIAKESIAGILLFKF